MIAFIMGFVLFGLGIYCVITKRNLIKIVIGFSIMEYALYLLFALVGYRKGGLAPIITARGGTYFVDPLPQALVLTAIVIGLATTALLLAVCVRLYEKYRTFDIRKMRRLKG